MWLDLQVQTPFNAVTVPTQEQLRQWCETALDHRVTRAGIVIRIVDEAEIQDLNRNYRGLDKPTNVLSFNFEPPPGMESQHLGDIVICAPVVEAEAAAQGKTPVAHWAHLVIHGILHLLGYDHQDDAGAEEMERTEITILKKLGFDNPYTEGNAV